MAEAIDFYNSRASELGDSLGAEVYDVIAGIVENPAAGFVVRPGVRSRVSHIAYCTRPRMGDFGFSR